MKTATLIVRLLSIATLLIVPIAAPVEVLAQATPTTQTFVIPFENTTEIDCGTAVDVVTYSSPLLVVVHFLTDGNGGTRMAVQDTFQGGSGVGTSGAKYRVVATDHTSFNTNGLFPFETTFVLTQLFLGQGRALNFLVHVTIHQTINANGKPTADVVNIVSQCR